MNSFTGKCFETSALCSTITTVWLALLDATYESSTTSMTLPGAYSITNTPPSKEDCTRNVFITLLRSSNELVALHQRAIISSLGVASGHWSAGGEHLSLGFLLQPCPHVPLPRGIDATGIGSVGFVEAPEGQAVAPQSCKILVAMNGRMQTSTDSPGAKKRWINGRFRCQWENRIFVRVSTLDHFQGYITALMSQEWETSWTTRVAASCLT